KPPAPEPAPPAKTGVDPALMDPSVNPCDDFYQYACGGFLRTATIPADQEEAWNPLADGVFDRNREILRGIPERDAAGTGQGPYARELGALYATCMDEAAIEKAGLDPLAGDLGRIGAVRDPGSLARELAHLHAGATPAAFHLDADRDVMDSKRTIAVLWPDGL